MLIEGRQLDDLAVPLEGLLRIGLESRPGAMAMVSAERAVS